jgi:hypothetical protein
MEGIQFFQSLELCLKPALLWKGLQLNMSFETHLQDRGYKIYFEGNRKNRKGKVNKIG